MIDDTQYVVIAAGGGGSLHDAARGRRYVLHMLPAMQLRRNRHPSAKGREEAL